MFSLPFLASIMCISLCSIVCSLTSSRSATPFVTKCNLDEDEAAPADDDDEWGIIHSPNSQPTPSRVQLIARIYGVEVCLILATTTCPSNLHLQRTRAVWAFSTVDHHSTRALHSLHRIRLVQSPMFGVRLLTTAHFIAYVADRLELAARRHDERNMGSTLRWTPRFTAAQAKPTKTAAMSCHILRAETNEAQQRSTQVVAAQKTPHKKTTPTRRPRMKPFIAAARYMDYEKSTAYSRKREMNIRRRQALAHPSN